MGGVIGDILPFALGVAISPIPIIAVILMLFAVRARQDGLAYLSGWVLGLTAVVVVVLIFANGVGASSGTPSTIAALIELGLGLLLVLMAFRQWKKRPGPGETAEMPTWMASIDTLTPGRAFGLGVLLSALNPKNLTLGIGAALAISTAAISTTDQVIAVIVFVVVGSLSTATPVFYYLVGGESARKTLDGWKTWLGENNATVMSVLLLVIGSVLASKGLGALIG